MWQRGWTSLRSALAFKFLGWALTVAPSSEKKALAEAINRYCSDSLAI